MYTAKYRVIFKSILLMVEILCQISIFTRNKNLLE